MIMGLIIMRTVNLTQISQTFTGQAQVSSHYKRLQRFCRQLRLSGKLLAGFVFRLYPPENGSWVLALDRTNWQWGKKNINVLMLSIVAEGTAIPLMWTFLNKQGASNTSERIELIERFIEQFGVV